MKTHKKKLLESGLYLDIPLDRWQQCSGIHWKYIYGRLGVVTYIYLFYAFVLELRLKFHTSLIYYNTNFPYLFSSDIFYSRTGFLALWRKVSLVNHLNRLRITLVVSQVTLIISNKWYVMHGCNFVFLGYVISNSSRLFFMLRRFPIESKGRRKKLHEVCACCLQFICYIEVLTLQLDLLPYDGSGHYLNFL